MSHKLLLGFKQNPTIAVDDCIDLGGSGNVSGKGYHLTSYLEGDITKNDFGLLVRDLTITLDIDDTTVAGALAKYHAIDRYIQQTIEYLEPFQGNYAGTTDGTWYDGFCASLTFQPQSSTSPVYWDVLGGKVSRDETYLGPELVGCTLENVVVTLTVRYSARGDLVTMCNLVAMGSFEPPFDPADSYYDADWTFTNTAVWSVDRTNGKFGLNALKWVGVASTTAFTNENIDIYDWNGGSETLIAAVSASIWLKASGVTGTTTVELQKYDGATWATVSSLASVAGNLAAYTYYKVENVALVAGTTKVRLKITTPTAGTVYFDGVAIWRSATVPVNGEYFTAGLRVMFPSTYLYGAVGDTNAPCILHVGVPTNGVGGPTDNYAGLMVGAREYNWKSTGRDSIPGMAGRFANGSANTALFWGKNGQSDVSASTTVTFYGVPATNLLNPIIRTSRKYRVLLSISTNVQINSVSLYMTQGLAAGTNKTFTKTIPSTAGVEDLIDLGDLDFPSQGSTLQNQVYPDIAVTGGASAGVAAQFVFAAGAHTVKFGGLILVPFEMFAYIEGGNYTKLISSMADPENGTVRSAVGMRATYDPPNALELTTNVTDNSDVLQVIPGSMQFEIIAFDSKSTLAPDLYPYTGTHLYTPTLIYQPRYLSGGM